MSSTSLWEKIDLASAPARGTDTSSEDRESTRARGAIDWRRRFRLADALASALWLFALTKLFIYDIDNYIITRFVPQLSFIINFRFFILIAMVAVLALTVHRFWVWALYVALFPLVLLLWKTPLFLYRRKSWVLALGSVNATYSFFRRFKRNFALGTLQILAGLAVLTSGAMWLTVIAATVLGTVMMFHYARALLSAVRASHFLQSQQGLVRRFMKSKFVREMTQIKPELRSSSVTKFNQTQQTEFVNSVSFGLLAWKGTHFYAYLLEKYRKSQAGFLLGLLSFTGLALHSLVALTLVNVAIYEVDPGQFLMSLLPSVPRMTYYSLSSLYASGVPGVEPVGGVALAVAIFSGIYGPLLVMTFALHAVLTYRQSRDENAFQDVMETISNESRALALRLEGEYEVSIEEAYDRFAELGLGLGWIVGVIARNIPDEFQVT